MRLSESRAWRPLGFRNRSDYARERLGVGARVVSEWARVWRALAALPLLREAVLSGEVSWTVARLVVGMASPQTEAACLETVRGRTVRAVETLLAAARAAEGGTAAAAGAESAGGALGAEEDPEDRVMVRVACPRTVGGKWNAAVELARRMNGAQLPVWACAEAIAAEVASALPPGSDSRHGGDALDGQAAAPAASVTGSEPRAVIRVPEVASPRDRSIGPCAEPSRQSDRSGRPGLRDREPGLRALAFPHLSWRPVAPRLPPESDLELCRLVEGLERSGPHELDRRLRAATAFLQQLDAEFGRVLRQVVDRSLYRELGFESFEHYVRERLDTKPRTARRLVRLARAEHRAPQVATAFRDGRVSALQADVLLRVIERGGPPLPRDLDRFTELGDLDGLALLPGLVGLARLRGFDPRHAGNRSDCRGPDACGSEDATGLHDLSRSGSNPSVAHTERRAGTERQWLKLAQRTTLRRLELEADAEPFAAVVFHAPPNVAAFFQSVLERVRSRLARVDVGTRPRTGTETTTGSESRSGTSGCSTRSAWEALEVMLDHAIVTWAKAGWAQARRQPRDYADFDRDGFRCTMPGCSARAELERHHVHFRSRGGPDVAENRTTLCWFHHHAAVHQGRARVSGRAPDRLLFELGVRPNGPPLARYRSGDVAL